MKKQKVALIGKGTAGALTMSHLSKRDVDIDWYYDSSIAAQPVGEGSTPSLPPFLSGTLDFFYNDLSEIDGTPKTGIYKEGWGNSSPFVHEFFPPQVGYHLNAAKLQELIFERLGSRATLIDKNVNSHDIKSEYDLVLDCSGRPKDLENFVIPKYIPVNSVHVNQCFWDFPRFNHSLTIARPYGWVFGIPLKNRCSIGYLYNNTINSLEEVKEDIKNVFEQFNLTPSDVTNSFTFGNYFRKKNYEENIFYNGNASFFLEPLEATSIGVMIECIHNLDAYLNKESNFTGKLLRLNGQYQKRLSDIELMIMLHYLAGYKEDTEFWRFAKDRAEQAVLENKNNFDFKRLVKESSKYYDETVRTGDIRCWHTPHLIGTWGDFSFFYNIKGLGIKEKLNNLL